MQKFRYGLYLLFLSLLFNLSGCVQASKSPLSISPQPTSDNTTAPSTPEYFDTAVHQLQLHSEKFGVNIETIKLLFISESKDSNGKIHVKLQPSIQNIPIWSQEIIVHLDENENIYAINNSFKQAPLSNTQASLKKEQAGLLAIDYLSHKTAQWKVQQSDLIIFPDSKKNTYELAYKVTLSRGLERHYVFVSALNSEILHSLSGSPRLSF